MLLKSRMLQITRRGGAEGSLPEPAGGETGRVQHVVEQQRLPFDIKLHERVPLMQHSVLVGGGRCRENSGRKWDGKSGQPRW